MCSNCIGTTIISQKTLQSNTQVRYRLCTKDNNRGRFRSLVFAWFFALSIIFIIIIIIIIFNIIVIVVVVVVWWC